jgi:hypothetical protein
MPIKFTSVIYKIYIGNIVFSSSSFSLHKAQVPDEDLLCCYFVLIWNTPSAVEDEVIWGKVGRRTSYRAIVSGCMPSFTTPK